MKRKGGGCSDRTLGEIVAGFGKGKGVGEAAKMSQGIKLTPLACVANP